MRAVLLFPVALAMLAAPAVASDDVDGPGLTGVRSGDAVAFAARDFDDVALGTPAGVDVRAGDAWSVRATGPADAIAAMRVRLTGHRLVIDYRDHDRSAAEETRARQVRFAITLPRLAKASVGGSGRMTVDRMEGARLGVAVGGSGSIAVARMTGGSAELALGGSGHIAAAGQVDELAVTVGGSGQLDAPRLQARRAEITAAGSGGVRAAVAGPARVSLVGSGHIDLGGGARCSVTKMGSGTVRCG